MTLSTKFTTAMIFATIFAAMLLGIPLRAHARPPPRLIPKWRRSSNI